MKTVKFITEKALKCPGCHGSIIISKNSDLAEGVRPCGICGESFWLELEKEDDCTGDCFPTHE